MTTAAGSATVRARLALWLFFASEVFLFGALLAVRFHLWGATRPDLDPRLGLGVTSILLTSSFFMNRAEAAIARGDRLNFLGGLVLTAALGVSFLIGVIGFEWQGELRPGDGVYGSILFAMTGLHAFHVLTGLGFIGIILVRSAGRRFTPDNHWGVEACAIYWHFVDLVWVFYYPALYLMGSPVGP